MIFARKFGTDDPTEYVGPFPVRAEAEAFCRGMNRSKDVRVVNPDNDESWVVQGMVAPYLYAADWGAQS